MDLLTACAIVGVNPDNPFPRNSKMPGPSFDLPASACKRGSELATNPGSMCHPKSCYAKRGFFTFKNVVEPSERRLAALMNPGWVEAFVTILRLKYATTTYFRWHASGDLQSAEHLRRIVEVAVRCPGVMFWLPTHEGAIVRQVVGDFAESMPHNLMIRISADLIGESARTDFPFTSSVHRDYGDPPKGASECRAHDRDNECGPCRACWSRKVTRVSYPRTRASVGVSGTGKRSKQLRIFQEG